MPCSHHRSPRQSPCRFAFHQNTMAAEGGKYDDDGPLDTCENGISTRLLGAKLTCAHVPLLQTWLVQSVPFLHPRLAGHFLGHSRPQSKSASPPFFTPSKQVGCREVGAYAHTCMARAAHGGGKGPSPATPGAALGIMHQVSRLTPKFSPLGTPCWLHRCKPHFYSQLAASTSCRRRICRNYCHSRCQFRSH
jgi:hypothetical protein